MMDFIESALLALADAVTLAVLVALSVAAVSGAAVVAYALLHRLGLIPL